MEGTIRIPLPDPKLDGKISLEAAIYKRRSHRKFATTPLMLDVAAQLLWSAGGQTGDKPVHRTAPSAGGRHPLTILAFTGDNTVEGVKPGIYEYNFMEHELKLLQAGDKRSELAEACLGQKFLEIAPLVIAIYAEYEKSCSRYGERGIRYSHIDTGHMGQNIYLQACALGLGTVAVGAFDDEKVAKVLGLNKDQSPLYVMPIGYPV